MSTTSTSDRRPLTLAALLVVLFLADVGHAQRPEKYECEHDRTERNQKRVVCSDAPALDQIDFDRIDSDVHTIEIVCRRDVSRHDGQLNRDIARFRGLTRLIIR